MTDPDNDPSDNDYDDLLDDYLQEDVDPDMQFLPPEKGTRSGVGMTTALLMSLVAAIAGALGGAAIAETIRYKSAPDIEKFQTELNTLSSEREAISDQLARTQSQLQTLSTQKPANLDAIEARLKTLETTRQPNNKNIKKLESRIDVIEAKSRRTSNRATGLADVSDNYVPSDLEARVEVLERRSSPVDMTDILERLDRLEVQSLAPINTPKIIAKSLQKTVGIPPLPKAKIMAAIDEQETESRNWLGRTLKKHVSIRDAGTDSPEAIISDIQSAIDIDDYAAALKAYDKLPSRARSITSDWRDAVEGKLKDIP